MYQFLLESPLLVGLAGIIAVGAAGLWWVYRGYRIAAIGAVLLALLTAVLVTIGVRVESDREQIRRTIDEVAEALADNDVPRVLSYIHAGSTPGVQRAANELPQYTFRDARMTRLRSIEVNRNAAPAAAIAEFNVAVEIEAQGQNVPIRRFVRVYFVEQDQRWLVRDYEHFEPLAGITSGD